MRKNTRPENCRNNNCISEVAVDLPGLTKNIFYWKTVSFFIARK